MQPLPRSASVLSACVGTGATAASLTTLLFRSSFPDPTPAPAFNGALAEARGWSAVTLALVVPALVASLAAARRGSVAGRLVWLGTLTYFVYTYLELAVSPPFTALYLVYIATFACAIPALVLGLVSLRGVSFENALEAVPRRSIAAFAFVAAAFLSLAWLKGIVARTVAGDFGWPQGEAAIGHVVHALDLGLQAPLSIAAGWLLVRRHPAGYVVAALMLVNALGMGAALAAMVTASALASGGSVASAAPFAALPVVALALAVPFFRALGRDGARSGAAGSAAGGPAAGGSDATAAGAAAATRLRPHG